MVDALPQIVPDPDARFAPFPLTDQQHAYLVGRAGGLELGGVSTHAYYEYEGDLDLERFDRAWQRVIDRHDMLRVVVSADSQRVLPEVPPFAAEVIDLRGLPEADVARGLAEVRDRLSHEVRPVDVYPVFAVVVSRLDDRRARVHISFDGVTLDYLSWQLLVADLTRFYAEPDLVAEPLELTFRDYVLAQRATTATTAHRRAEQYWKDRAAPLPPAPALPIRTDPATLDRPRWTSRAGGLDAQRWTPLKAAAARAGLTPTALILAVFAEVLALWSESPRFTVNVPRMNRIPLHPQANEILGEFASFSLLEIDHAGDAPFTDRAKAVQRQLWSDLMHQQVTGVAVLRELIRARGGFQGALMPVVLTSTLGFSAGERPLLGAQLPRVFAISQTPQVYLDVQVEENEGALVYNWDSVDAVFPEGLLDAACAAFGAALERLAVDADLWSATDLRLVPESHRTVGGIAGASRPLPAGLVQDAFLEQVATRPDAPAVVTTATTLTYGELHRRACQVGNWLRAQGATPDTPVAIVMAKGVEQVIAAYGSLLAGSPYLPVDASLPPARIANLLEQTGVRLALTQTPIATPPGVTALPVDALGDLPDTPLDVVQKPTDLAYVLFTSGSTGKPKGVMIEHAGMVNCLRDTVDTFGIGPDDRAIAVTALHHDMSTFDIFGVLGAGGSIVIPDADRARDADHWADLISAHGVTLWNSVPAMMEMLQAHGRAPGLRLAFLGGDWIPLHVARTLESDGVRLVSVGGPTETTLWNIWHPVEHVEDSWRSVPYGRPIANTRYRVLDPWLRDRPESVTGELYCSGPGVARGYWSDPDRTAASFIEHPVTGEPMYRTGDLGRCLPTGVIEFAGRADTQVKIRGQRIELGEIEAALSTQPGVRSAVVTAVPHTDRPGHRALVGHVTGTALDPRALRDNLRSVLGEHMIPADIHVHPAFPLTPNGKIDRAALALITPDSAVDHPPASPLEEVIAEVFAEELEVDKVAATDDFFALGGDSVIATRIVVRLREALDTPTISLVPVLSNATPATLAEALRATTNNPTRLDEVAAVYLEVTRMSDDEVESELMNG